MVVANQPEVQVVTVARGKADAERFDHIVAVAEGENVALVLDVVAGSGDTDVLADADVVVDYG